MHESDFFVLQIIKLVKIDLGLTIKVPKVTRVPKVSKVRHITVITLCFVTLGTPNFTLW
jgi:hypothetical protein